MDVNSLNWARTIAFVIPLAVRLPMLVICKHNDKDLPTPLN